MLCRLKEGREFVFNGDRTKDELVKFVQRLTGPPVQEIDRSQDFISIKNRKDASFLYIGNKQDRLWVRFIKERAHRMKINSK